MTTNTNTKRNTAITATIDGNWLRLAFANGERLELNSDAVESHIAHAAMMHGFKQKLVDAAAISRNPDTGRSATVNDKFDAVRAVFYRLTEANATWNAVREGGGAGSGGLLFRALCRMYANKTPDSIREFLEGKTDVEKAALRKNPRVAQIIDAIKAESAKSDDGLDTDSLLGELE